MTRISVSSDGENASRSGGLDCRTALPYPTDNRASVVSEPLTHKRVVAEIARAVNAVRTSISGNEVNGETNLALDLGFDSAARVELLLEVERVLDVALDVGVAVVFAETTIAELAGLIVIPEDRGPDWYG
jgi:acyl carrier protein